jgi:hypothetical protein
MKRVQDCNVAPMCSASPPTTLILVFRCAPARKLTGRLWNTVLPLHQQNRRLHAALRSRSRHAEESSTDHSGSGRPVDCAIYLHPSSDISRDPSQCTDTHSTDFSLCEALKQDAPWISPHTAATTFFCKLGTQTHTKLLQQPNSKDQVVILATSASMHHRMRGLQLQQTTWQNARYRTTRADISVYSPKE